ncbi:MAG: DeoR/GlpR family DNA-binding transcription regulator [Firmicutes bacterium]|nr:DeoR/GlpR family DNA-binding transcription regulator [Bacillota bacterium]
MLSSERQDKISEIILREGKAHIKNLSALFGVTGETIRRDLNELAKENKIKKVHGGAIAIKRPLRQESYARRLKRNIEEKRRIGKYAAQFISDNDVIAIDFGAATESLAQAIFNVHNIKILTNSIHIAGILAKKHEHGDFTGSIILLGGEVDCDNECAVGPMTNEMLKPFIVDKAFIGATSISSKGIMAWDANIGIFASLLIKKAGEVYILAESSKFGKETFYTICGLESADHIVTDNREPIDQEIIKTANACNTQLHVIDMEGVMT